MNETKAPPPAQQDDREINVLDLLIVLAKYKKYILGLPLLAAVIAAGVSLTLPNIYTASARILPPQQQQSSGALGQLGALVGGMAGGALGSGDLYVGMLTSRTVADGLIARFKLKERYKAKAMDDIRRALKRVTKVTAGKDGFISIEVDDEDPQHAADLANAYVDELYKLTSTMAVTESSQRRLFFEKQFRQAKDALAVAETAFKNTQERTGVISMEGQAQALMGAIAGVRAQIAAKKVEMSAMRTFATEQNPEYIRTTQEIAGLRSYLAELEQKQGGGEGKSFIPAGKVPELGLQYARRLRDVKYYEAIHELMAKQYELAKVEEARDTSIIQVLDSAIPPEYKSKPKRSLIVAVTGLATAFLVIIWAFGMEARNRALLDPGQAERIQRLRRLMRLRPAP